jgi:hypothetical protein
MSTKSANHPPTFDRATARKEIERLIENEVPNNTGCKDAAELLATEIITLYNLPTAFETGRLATKEETEKLNRLVATAKRLRLVWDSLDPELRDFIRRQTKSAERFKGKTGISSVAEAEIFQFMHFGAELIEQILPSAEEFIASAKPTGRRRFAEIRLVHACANVWEWRTGKRPRSAKQVPFIRFVEDIFTALHVKAEVSVENTIRAWAAEDGT